MAYDVDRNRVVIFGGVDSTGGIAVNDTWEWNGLGWNRIDSTGPASRTNLAMSYDEARKNTVLFGGWTTPNNYFGDTWIWDGTAWVEKLVSGPSPRANVAMAYDRQRQRIVLFGGSYYQDIYGDTWEWDGTQWQQVSTTGPSARIFSKMVYDSTQHKCLLFGGQTTYSGEILHDTWEWDGTSWTEVDTIGPPARLMHMMAYDPSVNRTILFGGQTSFFAPTTYLDDTWEWNGSSWTQIATTAPSPRSLGTMVYHSISGKVFLFGGQRQNDSVIFNETWTYSDQTEGVQNPSSNVAEAYQLKQNFPNPFNSITKIQYSIPSAKFITLRVYDILGREIVTLVNEHKLAGNYEVNLNGEYLPSGVYFYRMQAGTFSETKKLVLIR